MMGQLSGMLMGYVPILCVLAVGINGWLIAIHRVRRGAPLLATESTTAPPIGLLDLVGFFAIQIGGETWAASRVGFDMASLADLSPKQQLHLVYHLNIVRLGLFAIGSLWLWARYRSFVPAFSYRRFLSDLVIGFRAFCMIAPVVYVIHISLSLMWRPSQNPIIGLLSDAEDRSRALAVCGIAAVVAAPLFEELIFRRFLHGWLERIATSSSGKVTPVLMGGVLGGVAQKNTIDDAEPRDGDEAEEQIVDETNPYQAVMSEKSSKQPAPWWPLWISSGLFALMHLGNGPDPIPLFVFAFWLAYVYRQTGRLTPCIVIHLLLNFTSFVLLVLSTAK
jgi:membrane protease YdiL (CAAX protease family)